MKKESTMYQRFSINQMSRVHLIVIITLLMLITLIDKVLAQGNLLITPRRVVFEGAIKTQELNLANTGKDTARYNVSIVQYRMKEDGSFEEIAEPDAGQNFADKYIRFFPRSVTLAPNEAQVVKMQLTKTNLLTPGEYRSHVYFRAVPIEKALGEEDNTPDSTGISVRLVPIFGITIPVIIRVGESTTNVSFSELKFEMLDDTLARLNLAFNRTGNMSVYGDVKVNYSAPDGKITEVGVVKGIAVYTPNSIRRFKMDLRKVEGVDYRQGKLLVTYSTQSEQKPEKLAEGECILK
ncbi:MAG: molecular chaperone [Bacteroidales bacterium]|nr:molecular chaperone [Bacteroidales bacterium]